MTAFCSCDNTEPEPIPDPFLNWYEPTPPVERTLLIYSVAANNLLADLRKDSVEMVSAGPAISGLGKTNRVLLYFAPKSGAPTLSELIMASGQSQFKVLKTYGREQTSTHPDRIRQVWEDVRYFRPAAVYDMVLESHGTGWTPDFKTHTSAQKVRSASDGLSFSFGNDQTLGPADSIDIHELANAFDDRQLGFIWFDACYMAGVETTYQLRNKADWFVGYVTEIGSEGLAYEDILPYIARETPDLKGAAESMFSTFSSRSYPASISIIDLSKLEELAAATRPLVCGDEISYVVWLQNYARRPNGPFYDFGQYVYSSAAALQASGADIDNFTRALGQAVVHKQITQQSFSNSVTFDTEVYTGLSSHVPGLPATDQRAENYWHSLDWAKAAYE